MSDQVDDTLWNGYVLLSLAVPLFLSAALKEQPFSDEEFVRTAETMREMEQSGGRVPSGLEEPSSPEEPQLFFGQVRSRVVDQISIPSFYFDVVLYLLWLFFWRTKEASKAEGRSLYFPKRTVIDRSICPAGNRCLRFRRRLCCRGRLHRCLLTQQVSSCTLEDDENGGVCV